MVTQSPFAPDFACFLAGMAQFKDKYQDHLHSARLHDLLRIGKALYAEYVERETKKAGEHDEDDRSADSEFVWTADAVAHRIETVLLRAAHQIRRARFLSLLRWAVISWQLKGKPDSSRLLFISHAEVRKTATVRSGSLLPQISTYPPPECQDEQIFNLTQYDCMRVLLTEIRRLVAEERIIEVRVSTCRVLNADKLNLVFKWL
jgi:hypothetical protein